MPTTTVKSASNLLTGGCDKMITRRYATRIGVIPDNSYLGRGYNRIAIE
jgi:hypothetical protein